MDFLTLLKTWVEIGAHLATCLGILAAGWWFVFTVNYRKKIAFNVKCSAFRDPNRSDQKFVELMFELENKGQRENRCYTLAYELQSVERRTGQAPPVFLKRCGNIVDEAAEYYYVRAGVIQHVAAHLWIPAGVGLVRVKAFMLYENGRKQVREDRDL
jgi:hypothetical protein